MGAAAGEEWALGAAGAAGVVTAEGAGRGVAGTGGAGTGAAGGVAAAIWVAVDADGMRSTQPGRIVDARS